MNQKISIFYKDKDEHWVAGLECGHSQHVRHDPPWMERPWQQRKLVKLLNELVRRL